MQLRPLYDRIIVKRVEKQRATASGIVIPDNAAEKPEQGEIVAAGSGKLLNDGSVRPLQVKVGDQVLKWPLVRADRKVPVRSALIELEAPTSVSNTVVAVAVYA